jgi:SNF2 family DNA or RNA helicase
MISAQTGQVRLSDTTPSLSPTERKNLIAHLCANVRILFDDRDRAPKFFFGKADVVAAKDRAKNLAERVEQLETNAVDLTEGMREKLDRFLTVQDSFNQSVAPTPDWEWIKEQLRDCLRVQENLAQMDSNTKRNFSLDFMGLPVKPHQPGAIAWMVAMLEGRSHCAILADDMGLGKTVITLAVMCELTRRKQVLADEWLARYKPIVAALRIEYEAWSPDDLVNKDGEVMLLNEMTDEEVASM